MIPKAQHRSCTMVQNGAPCAKKRYYFDYIEVNPQNQAFSALSLTLYVVYTDWLYRLVGVVFRLAVLQYERVLRRSWQRRTSIHENYHKHRTILCT